MEDRANSAYWREMDRACSVIVGLTTALSGLFLSLWLGVSAGLGLVTFAWLVFGFAATLVNEILERK
jgi:hypothetical protein